MARNSEVDRLELERSLWVEGYSRVMGLDEVGRGCLCGPVVAAGVILNESVDNSQYRDSKTLSECQREHLAERIREESVYSVVRGCEPHEIDRINILQASLTAMMRCAESGGNPDYLLIDGNRFPTGLIPHKCIVKGDQLSASIAAASILAKVTRDGIMRELHKQWPEFGWDRNAGYPTQEHFKALEQHGYTPVHRQSFRLRTTHIYGMTPPSTTGG